jgi:hypothetical protein
VKAPSGSDLIGVPDLRVDVDDPMQTSAWCSLVGVPPAEKFRRQIEAG